jgi:hypothetical protein
MIKNEAKELELLDTGEESKSITPENETQKSQADEQPGVLTSLADLPEKALLDETAMAQAFNVCAKTVRRMVMRHELPPPIRVSGRSMWFAGRVLNYLESLAEATEKEAEQHAAKIRRISP